jgi:hypothetical protein
VAIIADRSIDTETAEAGLFSFAVAGGAVGDPDVGTSARATPGPGASQAKSKAETGIHALVKRSIVFTSRDRRAHGTVQAPAGPTW